MGDILDNEVKDPLDLRGLSQAVYIMRCIDSGISDEEIVRRFKGDEQLVNIWIMFLRGNHWLEPDRRTGKLVMTEKAKEWLVDHLR